MSHRERTRRIANEHARAEALVNDSLGTLEACRQRCGRSHALPDMRGPGNESNKIKYLREATDLIEKWQHQLEDGQSVSGRPPEHSEVVPAER